MCEFKQIMCMNYVCEYIAFFFPLSCRLLEITDSKISFAHLCMLVEEGKEERE